MSGSPKTTRDKAKKERDKDKRRSKLIQIKNELVNKENTVLAITGKDLRGSEDADYLRSITQ